MIEEKIRMNKFIMVIGCIVLTSAFIFIPMLFMYTIVYRYVDFIIYLIPLIFLEWTIIFIGLTIISEADGVK